MQALAPTGLAQLLISDATGGTFWRPRSQAGRRIWQRTQNGYFFTARPFTIWGVFSGAMYLRAGMNWYVLNNKIKRFKVVSVITSKFLNVYKIDDIDLYALSSWPANAQ
jgi:hypothetical protein